MKNLGRSCLLLFLILTFPASAKDLSGLYDTADLRDWQTRYSRSTQEIFDRVIVPALEREEKQKLSHVSLDFPLESEGELRGEPLGFYTQTDLSRVVMPIFSLKFLDDLCIAYEWLVVNGYGIETISEYVGMLKYKGAGEFPGGRYPPPLPTLKIPDDALQNPRVANFSFNTARLFILLHELGHIYHGHSGYATGKMRQARRNEEQADRFAVDVIRRTNIEPVGLLVFFMADAHWAPNRADFGSDMAWENYLNLRATHPLSGQRLRVLATQLVEPLATEISLIAVKLEDIEVLTSILLAAEATDESALAPRRPGELLSRFSPKGEPKKQASLAFEGFYKGEYVRFVSGEQESLRVEVEFQRRGNRVTGRYSFGLGQGTLQGTVTGNVLDQRWQWGRKSGYGRLLVLDNGKAFSGTWGYRESQDGGGTWQARREND